MPQNVNAIDMLAEVVEHNINIRGSHIISKVEETSISLMDIDFRKYKILLGDSTYDLNIHHELDRFKEIRHGLFYPIVIANDSGVTSAVKTWSEFHKSSLLVMDSLETLSSFSGELHRIILFSAYTFGKVDRATHDWLIHSYLTKRIDWVTIDPSGKREIKTKEGLIESYSR